MHMIEKRHREKPDMSEILRIEEEILTLRMHVPQERSIDVAKMQIIQEFDVYYSKHFLNANINIFWIISIVFYLTQKVYFWLLTLLIYIHH